MRKQGKNYKNCKNYKKKCKTSIKKHKIINLFKKLINTKNHFKT